MSATPLSIRPYEPRDNRVLRDIFEQSVTELARRDYTPEQLHAWTASVDNPDWLEQKENSVTVVAERENTIAGFGSAELPGHIDMLYVSPKFARQGVATEILKHLLSKIKTDGITRVTVHASITAKAFFEGIGFATVEKETVEIGRVAMSRYKMLRNG